jgi:hypothetical protein
MNAIKKRKKLLESFPTFGLKECCCGGTETRRCCGGDLYFTSKQGKVGVLLADEQEIQTIWKDKPYSTFCCGNYFGIRPDSKTTILFIKGKEVFRQDDFSPICYNNFLIQSTSETDILYYDGEEIERGSFPNPSSCNDYLLVKPASNEYVLYYKNKKISEGNYSSSFGCNNNNIYFDYFRIDDILYDKGIVTNNPYLLKTACDCNYYMTGISTGNFYYNGNLIGGAQRLVCKKDFLVADNYNYSFVELYYRGKYLGTVNIWGASAFSTSIYPADTYFAYSFSNSLFLFYKDKGMKQIEMPSPVTAFRGCGEYLFCYMAGTSPKWAVFYAGELAYITATPILANPECCGTFAIIRETSSQFAIYTPEKVIYVSEQTGLDQRCCNNRGFLVSQSIITVYDSDFGRMDFDAETFIRLDSLP